MSVTCLQTGRVREKAGTRGLGRYVRDRWRVATLPVQAFVVDRAGELCLFDAGQTPAAALPGYFPRWQPFLRLARFELDADDAVERRLLDEGLRPQDVRWLVLSHLHTDHVGGVGAFPHAEVVVTRTEWVRGAGLLGRLRGYLPEKWPAEARVRIVELDGPPVGPFAGTHDVAGDGTLLVVPLPGHTPGHAGLLVRGAGGDALLAGDAAHTVAELALVAPEVASWCARTQTVVALAHDDGAAGALAALEPPDGGRADAG